MMEFDEFVRQGLVSRHSKDAARTRNLIIESGNRMRFLRSIKKTGENAGYIVENAYDIIRELTEARLSLDGYKSSSHEATVAYLRKLGFPEADVIFIDEMRKTRHKIKYYGKTVDIDYALSVLEFLGSIYEKLLKLSK